MAVNKLSEVQQYDFDSAFWEYEDAQAKIVVYYPRNELIILWEEPFT
jgi:hypothetical protein